MPRASVAQSNEPKGFGEARVGFRPAVLRLHLQVGVAFRPGRERKGRARDAAVELCADSCEPVEERELPVHLVTPELERRDLGVLVKRCQRGLPRRHRLRILRLNARARSIIFRLLAFCIAEYV